MKELIYRYQPDTFFTDGWVKYTQTFYITEDKTSGVVEFHGFGMGIQLTGCYGGYAALEFFFVTPGGNALLDT